MARSRPHPATSPEILEHHDPASAIKALAHPARYKLIEALYAGDRELTATEAAELCGLTPSAMSYHLRALERYGLVRRGESTDGRERPWRKAADDVRIDASAGSVSAVAARAALSNIAAAVDRLLQSAGRGSAGHARLTVNQGVLRLSDEDTLELDRRVGAVIDEFAARELPPGPDAPPGRAFFWIRGNEA